MRLRIHEVAAVALAAAQLGQARTARAEGGAAEAAAVALFEEGKNLASAGDFEHACPKFAEAHRLVPSSAKLLRLGDCYEHAGALASSWGAFKQAEVMARSKNDTEREEEGARRAGLLAPRLAKLAIVVPPKTRVPGFTLTRDGEPVGEGQFGSALPVDSGRHTIEARAPGFRPWTQWIRVDTDGSSTSIEVPALDALPAVEAAPGGGGGGLGAQRIAGVAVGSVGVVGLVVGGVFGGITLSKASASKPHCAADLSTCDATGFQLQQDAHTTANFSNAGLAIGGAALVAGVLTFVLAPKDGANAPAGGARVSVGPVAGARMSGVAVRGGW